MHSKDVPSNKDDSRQKRKIYWQKLLEKHVPQLRQRMKNQFANTEEKLEDTSQSFYPNNDTKSQEKIYSTYVEEFNKKDPGNFEISKYQTPHYQGAFARRIIDIKKMKSIDEFSTSTKNTKSNDVLCPSDYDFVCGSESIIAREIKRKSNNSVILEKSPIIYHSISSKDKESKLDDMTIDFVNLFLTQKRKEFCSADMWMHHGERTQVGDENTRKQEDINPPYSKFIDELDAISCVSRNGGCINSNDNEDSSETEKFVYDFKTQSRNKFMSGDMWNASTNQALNEVIEQNEKYECVPLESSLGKSSLSFVRMDMWKHHNERTQVDDENTLKPEEFNLPFPKFVDEKDTITSKSHDIDDVSEIENFFYNFKAQSRNKFVSEDVRKSSKTLISNEATAQNDKYESVTSETSLGYCCVSCVPLEMDMGKDHNERTQIDDENTLKQEEFNPPYSNFVDEIFTKNSALKTGGVFHSTDNDDSSEVENFVYHFKSQSKKEFMSEDMWNGSTNQALKEIDLKGKYETVPSESSLAKTLKMDTWNDDNERSQAEGKNISKQDDFNVPFTKFVDEEDTISSISTKDGIIHPTDNGDHSKIKNFVNHFTTQCRKEFVSKDIWTVSTNQTIDKNKKYDSVPLVCSLGKRVLSFVPMKGRETQNIRISILSENVSESRQEPVNLYSDHKTGISKTDDSGLESN
ncbi:uncharacterized protein LOC142231724 [Haematobia irritans]|uniref:uncharacterized protein LOC142231724 n=1 Tax=Haematobia irritans TaxID=7368 RepID=UPI003F504536